MPGVAIFELDFSGSIAGNKAVATSWERVGCEGNAPLTVVYNARSAALSLASLRLDARAVYSPHRLAHPGTLLAHGNSLCRALY